MLQLIYSFAWKNSHMAIGLAFELFLSLANSESAITEQLNVYTSFEAISGRWVMEYVKIQSKNIYQACTFSVS